MLPETDYPTMPNVDIGQGFRTDVLEDHLLSMSLEDTETWLQAQDNINFPRLIFQDASHMGSNSWFELMMNYAIEKTAIERCRINHHEVTKGIDESVEQEEFDRLLNRWLWQEIAYAASEFGCEKHLKMQPKYQFLVGNDGQLWVSPADLRQFGDQAKRYVEVNERVGLGLYRIYQTMFESGVNTGAVVMSPTEEYQKYNSTYDVINLMRVVGEYDDEILAEGMYLVLGRVLSEKERRFVHNLGYLLHGGALTLSDLLGMSGQDLRMMVPVDRLLVDDDPGKTLTESQKLVLRPNLFSTVGVDLEEIAYTYDEVFLKRFGVGLLNRHDREMYPVIQNLVSKYFDTLRYYLWDKPDKQEYQRWFRVMLYECQHLWKQMDLDRRQVPVEDREWMLREHMWSLAEGLMVVGFEVGLDMNDNGLFEPLRFDQPFGYEFMGRSYCRQHHFHYEGLSCPKCKKIQKYTE